MLPLPVASRFWLCACLSGAGLLPAQDPPKIRWPDVRYEPSTENMTRAMLKLAKVKKGDVLYDLGSGDGRIVIMAAKEFGATGVGIDIDIERIQEARENARKAGVEGKVEFRLGDLFEENVSRATVVTLYLQQWINVKLRPKLLRELKPGTRIVSNLHDMGDWKPDAQTEQVDNHPIMLWIVPPPSRQPR
jgi:SAM-dependent methyltransferase